jgi:hypothetical protein
MKYATVEDVIASFPHPVLPPVPGEPDYHSLYAIRKMLRANARSIDTHMGGGQLDILASSYHIVPTKGSRHLPLGLTRHSLDGSQQQ